MIDRNRPARLPEVCEVEREGIIEYDHYSAEIVLNSAEMERIISLLLLLAGRLLLLHK